MKSFTDVDLWRKSIDSVTSYLSHDDEMYERHIAFSKDGVLFEMHRFYSHPDIDLEGYIIDGLGSIVTKDIDGHEFPSLPELANGLVLLDYLRHHLETGVGLRQLID